MRLFRKNPNEVVYNGGKKHFADVIKNTGPGELLIWRQPEEDFNTNSTLIVMPGEQAFFISGGEVVQVFDNGTYKLTTANYPFISRLRNAFTGGISTFNCVVYFVRKAHSAEILWGSSSPIQVRDKVLGIATNIRTHGSYKVQITNPAKFQEKLVGNNVPLQTQSELNKYFSNEFRSKIVSTIARALEHSNTELLGLASHLDEFSETIQPSIHEILDDYGLRCVNFTVAALDIEEDALRRKYDEVGMDAFAKIRNAQADRSVMDILGNDWGKQQAATIMNTMAMNQGTGGAMAGIGAGMAAGSMFGSMADQLFTPMAGHPAPQQSAEDPLETLGKLKRLLDADLIEQAEYDSKKAEILSRM